MLWLVYSISLEKTLIFFQRGEVIAFLFTLALIAYNGYLFPLTVLLDGSGLAIIIPVMLSFILPSLGYLIGIKRYSAKEDADKVANEVKK
ncbi:hypothetical protein HX13_07055 [Chryseobacterium sp. P1-3]|nr:hypothetical protein HX13_07055 [Chryseobacterium sp. P1-3]